MTSGNPTMLKVDGFHSDIFITLIFHTEKENCGQLL